MDKQKKRWLKVLVQLLIAVAAIYFVLNKIDFNKFIDKIFHIDLVYLALAFLAFNASKVLSAFRLNYFFRALGLSLQENYNLKLYYLGMLYNQVFPGGIGGDGYKVYLLNKLNKTTIKGLLAATLIDRISGVVALAFLSLLASLQSDNILALFGGYSFLIWIALILCYPAYYILVHYIFPTYKKYNHITNIQALGVQGLQVLCIWLLMNGIALHADVFDYFTLFLVSSVAAALPISAPGGVGIREYVMLEGALLLKLDESGAVALASLFFIISFLSALFGLFFMRTFKSN